MLKFIVIFVVGASIVVGGFLFAAQRNLLPPALAQFAPQLEVGISSARGTVLGAVSTVQNNQLKPLSDTIQKSGITSVDTNQEKPVHQKAFDYARYEYCQQVVRDFEKESKN